jgi:hypothetical protein
MTEGYLIEFVADSLKHFQIKLNDKIAIGTSMAINDEIVPDLLNMNWWLCTAPNDTFFGTCDEPVNVVSLRDSKALFGGGFALPNVEVAFPISSHGCLLLDRNRPCTLDSLPLTSYRRYDVKTLKL